MAGYNNYTYNKGLESLRNKVDQKIYQRRMQIIEEKRRAKSIRSMFDIFFNAEARERAGGDNWFETTLNATGEWFNHNFVEWFRNPVSGLLNNLSAIGSDLDYAANLIKAPLIAVAKGEDVGERLADAYGLGDKGRIDQNMSELREVLGADNPGGEIATTTGFGALSGAEIGSKGGLLGALIGAVVGAGVGLVGSSIDVGVRESGTTNSFLKGTQTVCNTLSDMLMEYGADPANFFGGIGNIKEFNKTKELTKDIAKGVSDDTVTNLASKEPACLDAFKKSAKGERAFKSNEILAVEYHRAAQLAQQPIKKNGKEIIRTAEQQRKFVEKRIKSVIHSYMNGDKKSFTKNIIETGIGKYLSDDEKVLTQQIDSIYKVLRHEANMSKVGRFAAFINNFDADFAKTLYKGTVPGLTLTMARKAVMKGYKAWENALLETAKKWSGGDIVKETEFTPYDPNTPRASLVEKAARQHYIHRFKKDDVMWDIPKDASQEHISKAYNNLSENIIKYTTQGYKREAAILRGIRRSLILDNGIKKVRLGDADIAFKNLIKYNLLHADLSTNDELKQALETLTDLFYFKDGISYLKELMYSPAYYKGDFDSMLESTKYIIAFANTTVSESPNFIYKSELDKISKSTFNMENPSIAINSAERFYSNKLDEAVSNILDKNRFKTMEQANQQQFLNDMRGLVYNTDLDDDTINRIIEYDFDERLYKAKQEYELRIKDKKQIPGESETRWVDYETHIKESNAEFANNIRQYKDYYTEVKEGIYLRNKFAAYQKAIDNSKEVKAAIDDRLLNDIKILRSKSTDALEHLTANHIRATYVKAAKELLSKGYISEETIGEFVKDIDQVYYNIFQYIGDSKLNSYDVTMSQSNDIGKGSTKIYNIIDRSRIQKPKRVKSDLTDEEYFLNKFLYNFRKSRKIGNNPDISSSDVKKAIIEIRNRLNDKENYNPIIDILSSMNVVADLDTRKRWANSIINFIFGTEYFIPNDLVNWLNSKNKDYYKVFEQGLFSISDKSTTLLYKLLTDNVNINPNSLGISFVNGRNALDDLNRVLGALEFAVSSNKKYLVEGDFIDNYLQQTVFNDTIEEIEEAIFEDPVAYDKNVFKTILDNISTDANVNKAIYENFNRLYNRRKELINYLIDLEEQSDIINDSKHVRLLRSAEKKYLQHRGDILVSQFKMENRFDELGDKLLDLHAQYDNSIDPDEQYRLAEQIIPLQKEYDDNIYRRGLIESRFKTAENNYQKEVSEIRNSYVDYNRKRQLKAIKEFKKETDEIYTKLNSLTKMLFMDNMDPSTFKLKDNKFIKTFSKNFLNTDTKPAVKEALSRYAISRLNRQVLSSSDFKYATEFLDMFADLSKHNVVLENGIYNIADAQNNIIYQITAQDFGKFFDSVAAIEKSLWLRKEMLNAIGLPRTYDYEVHNLLKKPNRLLRQVYGNSFGHMLSSKKVIYNDEYKQALDKAMKSYSNILSGITDSLTLYKPANDNLQTPIKSLVHESTNLVRHFQDDDAISMMEDIVKPDDKVVNRMIKEAYSNSFDAPYVANISIDSNGNVVTNHMNISEFYNSKNDASIKNKLSWNIIDTETTLENDNKDKRLLQLTIRTSKNKAYNILVQDSSLTNDYRLNKNELLDADYVNGNYQNIGGKLVKETDSYSIYVANGVSYMLFKTKKDAAIFFEKFAKHNNMVSNGVLQFAGHNSANFDAEILLRFIRDNNPNSSIKSIDTTDTLWLSRAIMATESSDPELSKLFADNNRATLGNLYKHWILNNADDDILMNAHNANADTLMNYEILEYIRNKIGDSPSTFFKDNLSNNVKLNLKDIQSVISSIMEDDMLNFKDANGDYIDFSILLDEMENTDYAERLIEMQIHARQEKLMKFLEITHIKERLTKNDIDILMQGCEDGDYDLRELSLFENMDLDEEPVLESYTDLRAYINFTYSSMYDNKHYKTWSTKMDLLHGDSKYIGHLNREFTTAYLLQNYSNVMNDMARPNALREIIYMLSPDNTAELAQLKPQTLIGDLVLSLIKVYDYDLDRFYIDFPAVKEYIGYTNRINDNLIFEDKLNKVLDDAIIRDPDNENKYRESFEGIITKLFGYRNDDNASLDKRIVNYIQAAKKVNTSMLKDIPTLKSDLKYYIISEKFMDDIFESPEFMAFNEEERIKLHDYIFNYVNKCLDNLEEYSLNVASKRGDRYMTILRPTPDSPYIDLAFNTFVGKHNQSILSNYQSKINNLTGGTQKILLKEQDYDRRGFDDIIKELRDGLEFIDRRDKKISFMPINRGLLESANGKTITQINGSMNTIAYKSANKYTYEFTQINKDKNYIFKSFGCKYDPTKVSAANFVNVESEFYKIVQDIKDTMQVSSYQMANAGDVAALANDPTYSIQKSVFSDYFKECYDSLSDDEKELYERFKQKIIDYKSADIQDNVEAQAELNKSIDAYFGALYMSKLEYKPIEFEPYTPLTKMENLINHTARYAQESNRLLNELFTDETGNINYALMAKYIKSNPYMKVVAMVPSDRFNNVDKQTKQAQIASEFITTDFKSVNDLQSMMTHKPDVDGIRYFVVDNHNLMVLKKMLGQSTSNKTYTGRTLFKNHPYIQKMMHFRDFLARYILLPTKILGLQNLGFTVTNTIEGFLKTMVATEGNKLKTVRKYKDAIQYHKNWSRATGIIANAIKGGAFYKEKNQWTGLLKELENSKILFGDDIDLLKTLLKNNDIDGIKKLMPSVEEFKNLLNTTSELTNYDKKILRDKYSKLWDVGKKTDDQRNNAIKIMAQRCIDTVEANDIITKEFNKEQFDFVTDFINSPAAAAEMQSIKKANELNIIGNRQKVKDGKVIKKDSLLDRFYKKALFSNWGFDEHNLLQIITPYYNLSLNSDIETINRLALHMDLLDKGYTHSESYNRVLQSFFNYGDKSEVELMAELFFPFISFPFRTTLFWDEMLDEHPQMIKVFADLVLTNWGKDAQNQYNQTGITKGGLKITPNLSMESGSSFLDSLVFGGNALNVLANRKLNPLLGPLVEGAKQLTIGGDSNWDYRLSRLPIVSKVMYSKELVDNLSKGNHALYDIAPSVFHKVYEDNRYYYNNQQRYNYRSIYSRLYTATGYNRWNSRTTKGRVNAVKYLQGTK